MSSYHSVASEEIIRHHHQVDDLDLQVFAASQPIRRVLPSKLP